MNTQTQSNSDAVMRAALKMAISAMQVAASQTKLNFEQTIQACKEALAQPAQEPMAKQNILYGYQYRNIEWGWRDEVYFSFIKHEDDPKRHRLVCEINVSIVGDITTRNNKNE